MCTSMPFPSGETEFTATAKELFFLNTLRKRCFNVVILDDKIAESTKHFSLNLISRSQDTLPQLRLGILSVTVTIVDDESKSKSESYSPVTYICLS